MIGNEGQEKAERGKKKRSLDGFSRRQTVEATPDGSTQPQYCLYGPIDGYPFFIATLGLTLHPPLFGISPPVLLFDPARKNGERLLERGNTWGERAR
jgi:hypothetical protein